MCVAPNSGKGDGIPVTESLPSAGQILAENLVCQRPTEDRELQVGEGVGGIGLENQRRTELLQSTRGGPNG